MRICFYLLLLIGIHRINAQVNFTSEKSGKNKNSNELNLFKFANVRDFALNKWGTEIYFNMQISGSEISVIV